VNRFPPGGVLIEKNGIRAGDFTLRVWLVIILKVIVYLLSVLSFLRRTNFRLRRSTTTQSRTAVLKSYVRVGRPQIDLEVSPPRVNWSLEVSYP